MRVIAGIPTLKGRENQLKRTIKSLKNQVNEIHVYDNSRKKIDKEDNGKFFQLSKIKEPVYFFSCDDDIIYPEDYVSSMIEAIEEYGCIVAHHGRILIGKDVEYFCGHINFTFSNLNNFEDFIDVAGTGVCAFRTDYFNPENLHNEKILRNSDLMFSIEAAKQGKRMVILSHPQNWLIAQKTTGFKISKDERHTGDLRMKLANQIIDLKN